MRPRPCERVSLQRERGCDIQHPPTGLERRPAGQMAKDAALHVHQKVPRRHRVRPSAAAVAWKLSPWRHDARSSSRTAHPSPCPIGQVPALSPRTRRPAVGVAHTVRQDYVDHGRLTSSPVEGRDCAAQAPHKPTKEGGRYMRVVEATRFGGPEVLVLNEAPDPVAGPGQVVVDDDRRLRPLCKGHAHGEEKHMNDELLREPR
jgi:hypothetical protein